MKKTYTIVIIIVCAVAIICAIQFENIAKWFADLIVDYVVQQRAMPDTGSYLCQECGTQIIFLHRDKMILYMDGTRDSVNVDYGNNLHGHATVLRAYIYWDQKKDVIQLTIKQGNEYLKADTEHSFVRTD